MKAAILLGLLALSLINTNVQAAQEPKNPWFDMVSSSDGNAKILAKLDSVKKSEKSVSVLIQYLLRDQPGANFTVKYYQLSISKQACDDGYGEVKFTPISKSKQDGFTSEYVEGGQSMAAFAAENLCYLYK